MSLVVAGSAHGSPGVSTALELVAASWPAASTPVIVEADLGGGVIAARHLLSVQPGIVSLAEALRRVDNPELLEHAQRLPSGVAAVPLAPSITVAATQLRTVSSALGQYLGSRAEAVFADVGSVIPGSPVERIIERADVMLWFARPVREELTMLSRRIQEVSTNEHAGIVLVGHEPYGKAEVESSLELPVLHVLPVDRKAAEAFQLGGENRSLRRSKLVRSCRSLAAMLASHVGARRQAATMPAPPAVGEEVSAANEQ